ncbi:hypothetical protein C8F04DRAFT_1268080 [Mycena alexandri]|uniref:Uncharacterized protein n=1 Tax=Mycena alexandri TaxID=1745969 RepID=A0AAD6SGK3_9AGAR|nr:hypothetical protein C8F04DRAFT_1268080 [Mycena alexandri]
MSSSVNVNHNIRTLVLMTDKGPFKKDLLKFVRDFKALTGVSIGAEGTKQEIAYRISAKMTEFEDAGDTQSWEAAQFDEGFVPICKKYRSLYYICFVAQ